MTEQVVVQPFPRLIEACFGDFQRVVNGHKVAEGHCPKHDVRLELRHCAGECGWCEECGHGWSIIDGGSIRIHAVMSEGGQPRSEPLTFPEFLGDGSGT